MKIAVAALGTRGDVQPYIALGQGLQAAGHQVCIVTHANFEELVCNHGLDFALVRVNPKAELEGGAGREMIEGGSNPIRTYAKLAEVTKSIIIDTGVDCLAACQEADLVLYSSMGIYVIPHIAEKLALPCISACLQPFHRTGAFPGFTSPTTNNLGAFLNRLTWAGDEAAFWWPFRAGVNQFRDQHLGLAPIPLRVNYKAYWREHEPLVYGFSAHVVPRPSDWERFPHVRMSGFWFLDRSADWQAPQGLVDFLNAGAPPVYVGFGSMSTRQAEETTKVVLSALERSKQRGVLVTGWGGLRQSDVPDSVYIAEDIPHDWLFPRMAAVVHHGGAGTTGAGIRAGVPSIVVPFFSDQPFWGQRVTELGVGPRYIPRKRLTVERLAGAIQQAVTDTEMQRRAAEVGERIRAEDGVAQAVAAVEELYEESPVPSVP